MSLNVPPIPKYYQVATNLKELITSGELQPSDQIPTEESLVDQYGVSRGTVRKAIQLLIDEGLVESEQGRGSFVTTAVQSSNHFSLVSFEDEMRRQARKPSIRMLKFELRKAGERTGGRLQIPAEHLVFQIERILLADDEPVAYECRIFEQNLCPGMINEDLENQSIHWLLSQKYNVPLVKMVHTVERLPMKQPYAGYLGAKQGEPAFIVDRLSFTEQDGVKFPAVLFEAVYRENSYYLHAFG
ncbi:MAG: GntR family transcriptional regulator [Chloroflexota bacterium]